MGFSLALRLEDRNAGDGVRRHARAFFSSAAMAFRLRS